MHGNLWFPESTNGSTRVKNPSRGIPAGSLTPTVPTASFIAIETLRIADYARAVKLVAASPHRKEPLGLCAALLPRFFLPTCRGQSHRNLPLAAFGQFIGDVLKPLPPDCGPYASPYSALRSFHPPTALRTSLCVSERDSPNDFAFLAANLDCCSRIPVRRNLLSADIGVFHGVGQCRGFALPRDLSSRAVSFFTQALC